LLKFVYAAILVAFLFLYSAQVSGQNLYTKAYGNLHDPAMIFIHGGPRGNAILFEATTAEKLDQQEQFLKIISGIIAGR